MRHLLAAVTMLLLGLVLIGCPPAGETSDSEESQAQEGSEEASVPAEDNPALTLQFLFDGGMQARLPCEPEEPEPSKESEDLRAATCQGALVHVTALWFKPGHPQDFDLKKDGEAVLNSAGAALRRREATHVASQTAETEIQGRPALRTELKGMVEERPLRVEALVIEGDQGGWGLQLLYNSDVEAAEVQAEQIFGSLRVEPELDSPEDEAETAEPDTEPAQDGAEESEDAPAEPAE